MKELNNKIIQTCTAIVIFGIIAYGIVYAQQVCCSTIGDACIPASNKISGGYNINSSCRISPSHNLNIQLQSSLCCKNILADFGTVNTCCGADRCDGFNQATVFSFSIIQDFYLLQKSLNSFDTGNGAQPNFIPYNFSIPHKAIPIYILTESIIC